MGEMAEQKPARELECEPERKLERKLAFVTGASRGIGQAICRRLAQDGMDIAFTYSSSAEAAKETIRLCEEAGAVVRAYQADIRDSALCDKVAEQAEQEFGAPIEVLVNNAGITRDGLLMRMKDEDLDAVLDTNVKGCFYMMRSVSKKMMRRRSGRIINISSIVGLHGNAGQVNYSASKAAVIGMTKSLAKELASRNVLVNAVAPGMIDTDMTRALGEKAAEGMLGTIPLGRAGAAEEIAGVVSFLAGPDSAYITGQVISVDGGMGI